jgi:hypothetical protein
MFLLTFILFLFFLVHIFTPENKFISECVSEVECSRVTVRDSEFGLGVFANKNLKQGEVIEKGVMTPLPGVDGDRHPHLFTWSDDRKLFAMASGCLPFYNHSDSPNVIKIGDLEGNRMRVVALRDIRAGEELRNRYFSKAWRGCFQSF